MTYSSKARLHASFLTSALAVAPWFLSVVPALAASSTTNLNVTGSYDFGSVVTGGTTSKTATLTFSFANLTATPTFRLGFGLEFSKGSATCTGSACTVQVGFLPQSAGLRTDALVVSDAAGNILATTYLHGIGLASQISLGPAVMTTFAGTGAWGYSGDGRTASLAEFRNPAGITADPLGNIYIADPVNQVIRKISAGTKTVSTIAGNGAAGYSGDGAQATKAMLYNPTDVAVDGAGNLFVADQGNNVVRVVTPAGQIGTFAGGGTRASGPDGLGDQGPATSAILYGPSAVTVDGSGNVFIADSYHHLVREVIAISNQIVVVAGGGKGGGNDGYGDGGAGTNAVLSNPTGLASDGNRNLYIADTAHSTVRVVNLSSGIINLVVGDGAPGYSGDGGAAANAALDNPSALKVDAAGDLFIADAGNNVVRELQAASGVITTLSTSGPGLTAPATLYNPSGLAFGPSGTILIADTGNNMIRQVAPGTIAFNFGNVVAGQTSSARSVLVSNTGNEAASLSVSISAGFEEVASGSVDCSASIPVGPGASCALSITFVPTAAGPASGTVQLSGLSASMAAITVPVASLSGNGISGSAPKAVLSPSSLTFGNVSLGSSGAAQAVVLANTGTAPLLLSNVWLQGANAQDFLIVQTTCTSTLAVNATCSVSVAFTPTASGTRTALLAFSDSAIGPQTAALSGTGIQPAPAVWLTSTSTSFGAQARGTTTSPVAVYLQNVGSAPLALSSITIGGVSPSDFLQVNNCGTSVAVGQGCIIWVSYSPSSSSAASSQCLITVNDNAAGSPHTYALSGSSAGWPQSRIVMDNPSTGAKPIGGTVSISGWALNDNAGVSSVDISVDGQLLGTATYGLSRPDVCAIYPGRVNCPNVGWSLLWDTTKVGDGQHIVQVRAWSSQKATSVGYTVTTSNLAAFATRLTKVNIDQPSSSGAALTGSASFYGWAINDQTAISSVSLIVDGAPLQVAQYGSSRPDVCGIFPGRKGCPNVGWSATVDTTKLSDGMHTLTVLAAATGSAYSTATTTFSVSNSSTSPIRMWIDTPSSDGATASGVLQAGGWAVGLNGAVKSVTVSVDGQPVPSSPVYGIARPDVCAMFASPAGCPNVGWSASVDTSLLSDGLHTLQVTAATNSTSLTSSRRFTVANIHSSSSDSISAWIDAPASNGASVSGKTTVSGWAVDQFAAITEVQLNVDGAPVALVLPSVSRPDVCAMFPGAINCPNVGWQAQIDTTSLPDGVHTFSITASSQSGRRTSKGVTFSTSNGNLWRSQGLTVNIDSPAVNATVSGVLAISGSALSIGNAFQTITVAIDGIPSGTAEYGIARTDVCTSAQVSVNCPNVGWSYSLDTRLLPDGPHTLVMKAQGTSVNAVASRTVNVANGTANTSIRAYIDSPAPNVQYSGTMQIQGWALDLTDTIGSVGLTVDGLPVGPVSYGTSRPDVCNIYPKSGGCPNVGWTTSLDTTALANGNHVVGIAIRSSQGHELTISKALQVSN